MFRDVRFHMRLKCDRVATSWRNPVTRAGCALTPPALMHYRSNSRAMVFFWISDDPS
jgi:hypothetical protein